jgi:hypothetical protein
MTVLELIGATTTRTGLKVECALDERIYQKGLNSLVGPRSLATQNITANDVPSRGWNSHPSWPRQAESVRGYPLKVVPCWVNVAIRSRRPIRARFVVDGREVGTMVILAASFAGRETIGA